MFRGKHPKEISFFEVAVGVIFIGAVLFSFGMIGWLFNLLSPFQIVGYPMAKIIGGVVIIALGYIIVELEWIRKEREK